MSLLHLLSKVRHDDNMLVVTTIHMINVYHVYE